jgi:predicted transcriptional regulator YheO
MALGQAFGISRQAVYRYLKAGNNSIEIGDYI